MPLRPRALIAPQPIRRPAMSITGLSPSHASCARSPQDKRAGQGGEAQEGRHSRDAGPEKRLDKNEGFEMIRRELDADCTIVITSSPLASPVRPEKAAKEAPQNRQTHKPRRQRLSNAVMRCHACGTRDTPEWRTGPDGPGTLCNVCGLIFQKQQRRHLRCLHCRRRRSYCSKEKPACSRCRDAGLECVYEGARKVLVNETYLRELEAKAKALDKALAGAKSEDQEPDAGQQAARHDFDEPLVALTRLSLSSTSFQGPASSDSFLRSVRRLSGLGDGEGDGDGLARSLYEPGALPSRRQVRRSRLPPIDIARRLFAAQYMYIGTIFAFTDPRESFEQLLADAYRRGPPDPADGDACLRQAKVLLVLAFGQLYSVNQWVDFRGPPGFDYFTDALGLLPETHEEGSVLCVETLALAGYFMANMNRRDAAFQYIGKAVRMAVSLGLHEEADWTAAAAGGGEGGEGEDEDEQAEAEHRRRVWWSVYSMDRILCVKSGNPIAIQDEDVGVGPPSRLPADPEYCPAVVLRHYTELSRILGRIHTTIYRRPGQGAPRSGRSLIAAVQGIMTALSRWHRELPEGLRFEPARLRFSRESVGALAHYYQCINMAVRPLLFHVVQRRLRAGERGDWREGLSPTTVRVVDMCVGAAQDVVNMMAIAAQRDMVATYGYMDGEHIFSATIVLVMVCAAFPPDAASAAAMEAGLGLLRAMGERGNSHMGARYELLASLHAPARASPAVVADPGEPAFPVVSNSALDEPLHDDMDLGLWEEGFAYPAMDLEVLPSMSLSDLMYGTGPDKVEVQALVVPQAGQVAEVLLRNVAKLDGIGGATGCGAKAGAGAGMGRLAGTETYGCGSVAGGGGWSGGGGGGGGGSAGRALLGSGAGAVGARGLRVTRCETRTSTSYDVRAVLHVDGAVDGAEDVVAARDGAVVVVHEGRAEDGGRVEDAKQHKVELGVAGVDVIEEAVEGADEAQRVVDAVAADLEVGGRRGRRRHVLGQVRAEGVEEHRVGHGVQVVAVEDDPGPLGVGGLVGVLEVVGGGEAAHPGLEEALVLLHVGGAGDVLGQAEAVGELHDDLGLQLHVQQRRRGVALELEAGEADVAVGAVDERGARQQGRDLPIPGVEDAPHAAAHLAVELGHGPGDGLAVDVELLGLADGGAEDVPRLDEARLRLVPVARVQQRLHVEQVVVADGDDAVQLARRAVVRLGEPLRRLAQVRLELVLQLRVRVLRRARAHHEQQARPLQAERPVVGAQRPPAAVLVEEGWGVDDVVVVVDVVEEVLDERVWGGSAAGTGEKNENDRARKASPVYGRGGSTWSALASCGHEPASM
ncbi:C6 transcription factor [Purpureocillium lavendulum]|uniref:C6 transcription factor n=1 Tax=Purpureocillium lavendulum TaxID=1247861 RepID=A0AB34FNX0_9HYPO|nr:C6 transcription factor [Purpureocillium lavendulum]